MQVEWGVITMTVNDLELSYMGEHFWLPKGILREVFCHDKFNRTCEPYPGCVLLVQVSEKEKR